MFAERFDLTGIGMENIHLHMRRAFVLNKKIMDTQNECILTNVVKTTKKFACID